MRITSVKNDPDKSSRTIGVEEKLPLVIKEEDYLVMGLYDKVELSEGEYNAILDRISFSEAKGAAIRYISLKIRCSYEIMNKLREMGYRADIINKVSEELNKMGYINDTLFIQKFLHDRNKLNPQSKKALRYELLKKGLKAETIDEVMSEWEPNEADIAYYLVSRKYGGQTVDDAKKRKIYAYLMRRGYSYEIIAETIARIVEKESTDKEGNHY